MERRSKLALWIGIVLVAAGVLLVIAHWPGWPAPLIIGVLVLVTAFAEPIYGALVRRPPPGDWRPTEEKFVDPETGQLVTVWFDPATGERRYVADGQEPGR